MKRPAYYRAIFIAQLLIVAGLGLAGLLNVVGALTGFAPGWGWSLAAPMPGLLLWAAAAAAPRLLAAGGGPAVASYRLVYDTAEGWADDLARRSLLNLARAAGALEVTWAREGEGTGCWLGLPAEFEAVLRQLVSDVFPGGEIEPDPAPQPGEGVALLRAADLPGPAELCRREGIEGVYYRWRGETAATVALWGPQALEVAGQFAGRNDRLPGRGETLTRPRFVGDNPWPALPPFPLTQANPALTAVSRLARLEPALRRPGRGLAIGQDAENYPVSFALPDLAGMQVTLVAGRAAAEVAVSLARQAIRAKLPVLFLDGQGSAATQLGRLAGRDVALGRVLLGDAERPARSHVRLNPLWLPAQPAVWPAILTAGWLAWLRELGVTPAGLGREPFQHTRAAVTLTALAAAGQGLALDIPALVGALESPDFLTMLERDALPHPEALDEAAWAWWLAEGRRAPNFDARLRLGHLRSRLETLLKLPEYDLLWRPPYLEPLRVAEDNLSLIWRLADPKHRLGPYISSQLLAISSLLRVWSPDRPLLIFLHELPQVEAWVELLRACAPARLVVSANRLGAAVKPTTLIVSRLHQDDAGLLEMDGIRPADLRRLPENRLLVQRGRHIGTVERPEG